MDADRYTETTFGRPVRTPGAHGYVAYLPSPLPRSVDISPENLLRLADAEAALGRLAGAGRLLPHPQLLVGPYLRREAVSSTRIEGTQASLAEVFDAEASDLPLGPDVEEVINYVRAMEAGLQRLSTLPLSTRLIREMHAVILAGGGAGPLQAASKETPPPNKSALAPWVRNDRLFSTPVSLEVR
mgnify:CR=1 FL=1